MAGRVLVSEGDKLSVKLVDLREPCAIIPNVAIHMNRNANDGMSYNAAVDMLPVWMSSEKGSFRATVAKAAGVSEDAIVTGDLFLYDPQKGVSLGEYISAPRLDDLQCAFSSLTAFLAAGESRSIPVCCIFDNEEVGSETKQGAASTFLYDTLTRLCAALGMDGSEYRRLVAGSFLVSCDNAHAVHPNHGEFADRNHTVRMNGGVVIKYNANPSATPPTPFLPVSSAASARAPACGAVLRQPRRHAGRLNARQHLQYAGFAQRRGHRSRAAGDALALRDRGRGGHRLARQSSHRLF